MFWLDLSVISGFVLVFVALEEQQQQRVISTKTTEITTVVALDVKLEEEVNKIIIEDKIYGKERPP